MARADLKAGGASAPALMELASTGEAQHVARWLEWERATKGRRAFFWSRGLKARLGIGETTDEDAATAEPIVVVAEWECDARTWRRVRARGRVGEVLDMLVRGEPVTGFVRLSGSG
jgi:hypothetical protein